MGRRLELDAARGLMLVWIALTHLPTDISTYTNQPFGFVSAAEGFILLSALFTGRIYVRMAEREGYSFMWRKVVMRASRLYAYQALLLCFAFAIAAPLASDGGRVGLYNLLDFYFAAPTRAIIDAALLIYRPPLLDILPLYIVFLALTPVVLTIAKKIPWIYILGSSFMVWLLAQFGLKQAVYSVLTGAFGLRIPLKAMGAFDLWAWQFMWVIGLWLGARWARNDLPIEDWAKKLTIPAAVFAAATLSLRYAVFPHVQPAMFGVLFDKCHLGVTRLLDFAAVAALLIRFPLVLRLLTLRPLILLGQASLPVFCSHLLFCFVGLTIMGSAPAVTGWQQIVLALATVAGMFATAKIFALSDSDDDKRRRPRPVPRPVVIAHPSRLTRPAAPSH